MARLPSRLAALSGPGTARKKRFAAPLEGTAAGAPTACSELLLIGLLIAILMHPCAARRRPIGPLSTGDFGSLAYKLLFLVFLGAAVLTMFRERFSQAITAALLWVVVGLVLVVGYSYRFELNDVADRVLCELVPGHVVRAAGRRGRARQCRRLRQQHVTNQ